MFKELPGHLRPAFQHGQTCELFYAQQTVV
jgi:hypothetical protein